MQQPPAGDSFDRAMLGIIVAGFALALAFIVVSPIVGAIRDEATGERQTAVAYSARLQGLDGTKVAEEKLRQETVKVQSDRQQANNTRALFSTFLPGVAAIVAVITLAGTLLKQAQDTNRQRVLDRQQRRDAEENANRQRELDRQQREDIERSRRDERFNAAVAGLGAEHDGNKASAIVTLDMFLHLEFTAYHQQVFKLIVANLKIPQTAAITRLLLGVFERAARQLLPTMAEADRRADLDRSYAALEGVNLPNTDLRWARLHQAQLAGADFAGADLRDTVMTHAKAPNARFLNARFAGSKMQSADLRRCQLQGALFSGANLRDTKFYQAGLDAQTDFTGAEFDDAALRTIVLATNWRTATFDPPVRARLDALAGP